MFTLLTLVVALVVAFATGGRPRHLAEHTFRFWALPVAGVVLDVACELDAVRSVWFAFTLASYACLVAFMVANIHLRGMFLVLIGVGLNILTIVVNVGMPVRAETMVDAGVVETLEAARAYDYGAKHHLERPGDDRLMVISDIIPLRPLTKAMSIGDVIMAIGIGVVVFHLTRPPIGKRRRDRAAAQTQND